MTLTYSHAVRDIHIIKNQAGLDEETYRDIVEQVTGKRSVKDLPLRELELVLVALRRIGSSGRAAANAKTNGPQHGMIAHLMEYLGWNWQQTAKLCKRITGWSNTQKCSAAELRKVITAMVHMVEQNHTSGKRTLTHTELFEFRRHTQRLVEPAEATNTIQ